VNLPIFLSQTLKRQVFTAEGKAIEMLRLQRRSLRRLNFSRHWKLQQAAGKMKIILTLRAGRM